MKKISLLVLLFGALAAFAQDQTTVVASHPITAEPASYTDLYCAGFVTRESVPMNNLVVAGLDSPHEALYGQGETVFLSGGGFEEGKTYAVIRELTDPNKYQFFPGQNKALSAMGQPYADIGHVKVTALRGSTAVAQIVFSCQSMTAGDIVVPLAEKQSVMLEPPAHTRFPTPGTTDLSARIILAREFDGEIGYRSAVYINAGSGQGVKVGDRFRAMRSYDSKKMDPVDALSYDTGSAEDTQKNVLKPNKSRDSQLPSRMIGELVVVTVTPTSSTLIVSSSLEPLTPGDEVERIKAQ